MVPKDLPRNESRPILMPIPQIPPPQATLSSYIKHCSLQDVVCNARYLIVIALMLASEGAEDQVIRSKNITALLTLVG